MPTDFLESLLAPKETSTAGGRPMSWTGVQGLLLEGFEIGMKTLADRVPMYVRVTWEPPWPCIVRTPRVLMEPQLGEVLGRIEEVRRSRWRWDWDFPQKAPVAVNFCPSS